MSFLTDNKREIIFVLVVLLVLYCYYTNFYTKGKRVTDVFAKPVAAAAPPAPVVAEEPAELEEFSNDIKHKYGEESLRRFL